MSDKRKRLLASALDLFVQNGFQGTPTSEVARHAGVATGTLFHHFGSKLELIEGVYQFCRESRDGHINLSDNNQSIEQRMKEMFVGRIKWGMTHGSALIFINMFENSTFHKGESAAAIDQELLDLINEGQASRKLRLMDSQLMFLAAQSLLGSIIDFYVKFPDRFEDELHKYASFNFFWTALKY